MSYSFEIKISSPEYCGALSVVQVEQDVHEPAQPFALTIRADPFISITSITGINRSNGTPTLSARFLKEILLSVLMTIFA
jgi:hypothetical protein